MSGYPTSYPDSCLDGSGSLSPNKAKFVLTLDDLPDPTDIGGVMTIIPENCEYVFAEPLNLPYPIGFPGEGKHATFKSINRAKVTYTGFDALWRDPAAQGNIEIVGLVDFSAPNGDMWDLTAGISGFSFQVSGAASRFSNCNSLGTLNCGGNSAFNLFFGSLTDYDQGLVVNDPVFFEINTVFCFSNNQTNSTHFTVQGTSTLGSVNFINNTFSIGNNETVWDINPDILSTVDAINIHGNTQEGGVQGVVYAAGSVDFDTPKLFSVGNSFTENTKPDLLASMHDNLIETVITAADTPVPVAGNWNLAGSSQFSFNPLTGEATYLGINDLATPINISFTSTIAGGGSDKATYYIAVDGLLEEDSAASAEHSSTNPTHTVLIWGKSLSTGAVLRPYVENNSDSSNILVESNVLRYN